MLLPDPADDEQPDEPPDELHGDLGEPPVSRWSQRMPSSVGGLLVGAVVCVVVIAVCLAVLAGAVGLLVRA